MPSFAALIAPSMPGSGPAATGLGAFDAFEAETPFSAILTRLNDEEEALSAHAPAEEAVVSTAPAHVVLAHAPLAIVPNLSPSTGMSSAEADAKPVTGFAPNLDQDLPGQALDRAASAPDPSTQGLQTEVLPEAAHSDLKTPQPSAQGDSSKPPVETALKALGLPQSDGSPDSRLNGLMMRDLASPAQPKQTPSDQAQSSSELAQDAAAKTSSWHDLEPEQGRLEQAHRTAAEANQKTQVATGSAPQLDPALATTTQAGATKARAYGQNQAEPAQLANPQAETTQTDQAGGVQAPSAQSANTPTYSLAASLQAQIEGQAARGTQAAFEAPTPLADLSQQSGDLKGAEFGQSQTAPTEATANTSQGVNTSPLSGLAKATIETTAQISAQILRKLEGRSTRFDMTLTPEALGRVDVSLTVEADGQVSARLAFDNPAAATELRGRVDDLRRQLAESGLNLNRDNLEFTDRNPHSGSNGSGFSRDQDRRAFVGTARLMQDADQALLPLPATWASPSLTPDRVDVKV